MLNKIVNIFNGYVAFSATNGFCERLINLCAQNNIVLNNLKRTEDGFVATSTKSEFEKVKYYAKKSNVTVTATSKKGLPFLLHKYKKRGGFLVGAIILLASFMIANNFVWEIEIKGNKNVSTVQIAQELYNNGVKKFAKIKNINPENVKNDILIKIPELSWLTINISGCKITVLTSERTAPPPIKDNIPCDVVAKKSGQIIHIDCYEGEPLLKSGYTVLEGEKIISNEFKTKKGEVFHTHADAKVIAQVQFEKTYKFDLLKNSKEYNGKEKTRRYFDIFGMKIPLFIYSKTNEKFDIEEEKLMFSVFSNQIPIGIITKKYKFYELIENDSLEKDALITIRNEFLQYEAIELKDAAIISREDEIIKNENYIAIKRSYITEENIAKQIAIKE